MTPAPLRAGQSPAEQAAERGTLKPFAQREDAMDLTAIFWAVAMIAVSAVLAWAVLRMEGK